MNGWMVEWIGEMGVTRCVGCEKFKILQGIFSGSVME